MWLEEKVFCSKLVMGNLSSFEVNLDDFDIKDPTPLDENQKVALNRGKTNGRLDFSLQNLTDIPIQIFEFDALVSLNISVNKIKFLPQALWQLSKLQSLDISANELEFIPEEIGHLTDLKELNLRHNLLTFLPDAFGQKIGRAHV